MRRPRQLGYTARALHEKATSIVLVAGVAVRMRKPLPQDAARHEPVQLGRQPETVLPAERAAEGIAARYARDDGGRRRVSIAAPIDGDLARHGGAKLVIFIQLTGQYLGVPIAVEVEHGKALHVRSRWR